MIWRFDIERIERGIKNTFQLYDVYVNPNVDLTYLQPEKVAEKNRNTKYQIERK